MDGESGGFSVFDTDFPDGNIARHFPANSQIVDFSKTAGRVHLFDTVMAKPNRYQLADIQPGQLNAFFETFQEVEFDSEAYAQGIHVVIYYMLDKSFRSLQRAAEIQEQLTFSQFFLVENEAIGKPDLREAEGKARTMLNSIPVLRFPRLSTALVDTLEDHGFSLFAFMAGNNQNVAHTVQLELWNLLEFLYQQRSADREGITHFI